VDLDIHNLPSCARPGSSPTRIGAAWLLGEEGAHRVEVQWALQAKSPREGPLALGEGETFGATVQICAAPLKTAPRIG